MEEFFAFVGLFTFPLTIGFGVAWWMTRAELRRLRGERQLPLSRGDRFDRLEHAVEAIALEVERISEGQRFTTKLLAERESPDRRGARPVAGVITPH